MGNKVARRAAQQLLDGKVGRISDNTSVLLAGNGAYALVLFGNTIAIRYADRLKVTTAGWPTVTTTNRLNALPGVSVSRMRGNLYLNGKPWDGYWTAVTPKEQDGILPETTNHD